MPLGGVQVGSYDGYEQAQAAVDYLSDEKFAVENVTIIGSVSILQLRRTLRKRNHPR